MFDIANRETMMLVAVIVSLAATYYLYTEMKKQKEDMLKVKTFVSHKMSQPPANDEKKQEQEQEQEEEEEEY